MALPSISKSQLNMAIKELPKSVQAHLKRCRLLADFVLKRIEDEDWFLEEKLNPEHIVSAIGYHDIGKLYLPREAVYIENLEMADAENAKKYKSHVNYGVAFVERECGVHLDKYRPTSFAGVLYRVLSGHHLYLDGRGFPEGEGDDLCFAAKLCMVVDTFDHLLFAGRTVDGADINKAIEELYNLSGMTLDSDVVNMLLADIPTLRNYIKTFGKKERTERSIYTEEYGIVLRYEPYYNIAKQRPSGYRVRTMLHDPYFGIMQGKAFLQMAEMTGQIGKFERLAFEKLCISLELMFENTQKRPRFIFDFSARNFEKEKFADVYLSVLRQYEIPPNTIYFAFKEAELLHAEEGWQEVLKHLREEGIGIMVDDFGDSSSLLSQMGEIQVDMLGLKREYTQRMTTERGSAAVVAGLAKISRGLYVNMIAAGVTNARQEAEYAHMQVKYAMGDLYGKDISFKELKSRYNETPMEEEGDDQ